MKRIDPNHLLPRLRLARKFLRVVAPLAALTLTFAVQPEAWSQTKTPRERAIDIVAEAARAFARGDGAATIALCQRAIGIDPTYPRAYSWLGAAHQRRGERSNACNAWSRVVQLAPGSDDGRRAARGLSELNCPAVLPRGAAQSAGSTRPATPSTSGRAVATGAPVGVSAGAVTGLRLQARFAIGDAMEALTWSSDGQKLSVAASDGAWRLIEAAGTQTKQSRAGSIAGRATAVAASARLHALGSSDGSVRLFEVGNGRRAGTIEARSGSVHALAFSPRGDVLAIAGPEGALQLIEADSRRVLHRISSDGAAVYGATWSPDGRQVAAAFGTEIHVIDARNGAVTARMRGDHRAILALDWSRDGRWIAGANGPAVRIWDATTGKMTRTLTGHRGAISALSFGEGAALFSGAFDGEMRSWNVSTGTGNALPLAHRAPLAALDWNSTARRLASLDRTGEVGLWQSP